MSVTADVIKTFRFPGTKTRVRACWDENGTPWFVTKDICRILYLEPSNCGSYGPVLANLEAHEKTAVTRKDGADPSLFHPYAARVSIISESGALKLIHQYGNHPDHEQYAEWLEEWLVNDVLPGLRKEGCERSENELILKAMSILIKRVMEAA